MHIILLGAPGSGKGTQAALLNEKYDLMHISTGDLCRKEVASGSLLGQELRKIMEEGNLIPDHLMLQMLKTTLLNVPKSGFILDGFPRTLPQAEALDDLLDSLNHPLDVVIEVKVDKDFIISRLSGRITCAQCGESYSEKTNPPKVKGVCDKCGSTKFTKRADDQEETILKRLEVYSKITTPLIPYYQKKGKHVVVDGNATVEEVFTRIEDVVRKFENRQFLNEATQKVMI